MNHKSILQPPGGTFDMAVASNETPLGCCVIHRFSTSGLCPFSPFRFEICNLSVVSLLYVFCHFHLYFLTSSVSLCVFCFHVFSNFVFVLTLAKVAVNNYRSGFWHQDPKTQKRHLGCMFTGDFKRVS